jgi:STE24 endopeptidase
MDENRKILAKKYEKIKLTVGITEGILSFILLILFVALGYSKELELLSYGYTSNPYLALLIFGLTLGLAGSFLSSPVDYIFGFKLEHKFGLSNQTLGGWIGDKLKGALVGSVLGAPIGFLFYYLIKNYRLWWLYLACIVWVYTVLLAQIAPILIFPIFYKFKPIENQSLREKILNLCTKVGFKVKGVFTFDMSKNTKKANAAFTGMGKTKRIILADTLISGFSDEEIETVFAHELGHYKKGHIKKNILFTVIGTFTGLFITAQIYNVLYPKFGFSHPWDIGALPLIAIITSVLGFLTKPIGSMISRKFEYEADRFAVETTGNFPAFKSTMEKLAFQNLADTEPNEFTEFWFYSHPSIKKRIKAAEKSYKHNS